MGKKNYTRDDVSPQKTTTLGQGELFVLGGEGDDANFYALHRRYFEKEKSACPACGSMRTRCSKIVNRTFKDIIGNKEKFNIIDLHFYQRYLRCDSCGASVFPEPISFGEKSVRYTNRLADILAEGTFCFSYKKVCERYGVPASTASVGAIMRRQIQTRESKLYPLRTPGTLCIAEVPFYGDLYPVILALEGENTYCVDILRGVSEEAYVSFFKMLDSRQIETVCIEPNDELRMAVASFFPKADVVLTDECILRYAREALLKVISADGKRMPLQRKKDRLILHSKHFPDTYEKRKIEEALCGRTRLKAAYEAYQDLLDLLEIEWTYDDLALWVSLIPDELTEFDDLRDVVNFYSREIVRFVEKKGHTPEAYRSAVKAVCDSVERMPHCIFDVFRARCLLTVEHDNLNDNGKIMRLGVPVDRMQRKMNEISSNIKERREYGFE